ncbi:DNA adenine methylase [Paenibacillus dendritiformis]|uniref:DNA adenine methylase n=1 Tax=Paenibacillus dendritiformis TaxID=130049 RepID=UPI00387E179D
MKVKHQLIKSPLNYTGGKHKLLPQLLPFFPKEINRFIDLFAGGCNVGVNVEAEEIICNDIEKELITFYNVCKKVPTELIIKKIEETVFKYKLSKENYEGYRNLRADYNSGDHSWYMFYTLIAHSFSNQIRFNSKREFNLPFGKRTFNPALKEKLIFFAERIKLISINFRCDDYKKVVSDLRQGDFVYCDPPYLIANASYNESGGWTDKDEHELLNILDELNGKNIKFALSNVLNHKGKENKILKDWSKKYNIHRIYSNYKNCNYHTKDRSDSTFEVLITNYNK